MLVRIAFALIFAGVASSAAAGAQESRPSSRATVAAIVGRYEYRDAELVAHLVLRGDQTFEYKVDGIGPPVEGEDRLNLEVRGVWRFVDSGNIVLTNAPTTPPVLRQTSAVRDPKVRASFIITSTDGTPIEDLGVLTDDGDNGQLNMLSDGGWTIPLRQGWNTDEGKKGSPTRLPRNWEIIRSSDNLSLVKINLTPNGPNRFTFRYTPSPIQPFRLAARPVDDAPGMMEVELGMASIKMRRVASR